MLGVCISYIVWMSGAECGPYPGDVGMLGELSDHGFGTHKRLLVVNLTAMGGVANIPEDEKAYATMSTYVNGSLQNTYDIGVEHKGRGIEMREVRRNYKLGLGIETREWDGGEWDGADTQMTEFGFQREYEDYVIRREYDDKSMVLDGALFLSQPAYYEYVMVEVVYVTDSAYTYEGVFYFVNNPAKRKAIPNAVKLDPPDNLVNETTYIIEHEPGTDDSCALAGHPDLECKYPKPSKLNKNNETLAAKAYLESVLTFQNPSALNWSSLGDEFVAQQTMLGVDLQRRSMLYHIVNGQLHGGPRWDAEHHGWWAQYDKWIILDAPRYLDWWEIWLEKYEGSFVNAIRASNALNQYSAAFSATEAQLRSDVAAGFFDREMDRWPCVDVLSILDKEAEWHHKRAAWMQPRLSTFKASDVTYMDRSMSNVRLHVAIAAIVLLVLGALLAGRTPSPRTWPSLFGFNFATTRLVPTSTIELRPLRF